MLGVKFPDATSGLIADFLRLVDVNAGGLWLKRTREFYSYANAKDHLSQP